MTSTITILYFLVTTAVTVFPGSEPVQYKAWLAQGEFNDYHACVRASREFDVPADRVKCVSTGRPSPARPQQ